MTSISTHDGDGVSDADFATIVHPAANTLLILREGVINGAFQVENPAIGPKGSFVAYNKLPLNLSGITRP